MNRLTAFCSLTILTFALLSCNPNRVYDERQDLPMRWNQGDERTFSVNVEDASPKYDIVVGIGHHANIGYGELEIAMTVLSPSGSRVEKRYTILLKKDGKFVGEVLGDIGDVYQTVEKEYQFSEPGVHKFAISHTEDGNLGGIQGVTLRLDKQGE